MSKDLQILISGLLDTDATAATINKQLIRLERKINQLNLNIGIDMKAIAQLKEMSAQLNGLSRDAQNTKKVIEEAIMPDGTRVKRTHFDGLNSEFSQIREEAKKTKKEMEQVEGQTFDSPRKSLDEFTDSLSKNAKISKEVTSENAKGQKTFQDTYKSLQDATTATVKYNEENEVLNTTLTKNHEQEQRINKKRLSDLQKISKERAKLRRELQGMQSSGQISDSQFQDLTGRLSNVKDTTSLNRYKESMSNLVAETNKATASQTKLNQAQGKFRTNLEDLQHQGRITEQQLKQFGSAIDTSKSVGQLKQLERQLDRVKTKANSSTKPSVNSKEVALDAFDTNMAIRKFESKASEAIRQYPSIDRKAIANMERDLLRLASTTGLTRGQIEHYNQSLVETVTNTKRVTANTNTMTGAFQNAMLKFPIIQVGIKLL